MSELAYYTVSPYPIKSNSPKAYILRVFKSVCDTSICVQTLCFPVRSNNPYEAAAEARQAGNAIVRSIMEA